jgi:hypothetical protein
VFLSYGTSYHTGVEEDWESLVADAVGGQIKSHGYLDVNGCIVDYKHHVGSSQVPHTRHTAIARERLWSILWAEAGEYPKSQVILRSHVHYHNFAGGVGWAAMTTPGLQGVGTKYGSRNMSGTVDFGIVVLDIASKEEWTWRVLALKNIGLGKPVVVKA